MSAASSPARENQPEGITMVEAAKCGDVGTVEVLIAAGVDVNSATEHGMTALMSAAANGHLGLVSLLVERGADINAKRCDSLDALALAVFFGHLHVVRELLDRGADLKAKSRFGTSPEMWATTRGFHDIAQILNDAETVNSRESLAHRSDESNASLGFPSPGSPAGHPCGGESGQPAWSGASSELTGAEEPILPEAFFSDEGFSDETLPDATATSPIPAQITPDSAADDEWTMGSTDSSEVTLESPASVWNLPDEGHQENQVQPRNDVPHNGANISAPVIIQRPRTLPVEKQPFPVYSTYVAKPRYHHKRRSRKLVRFLAAITSGWQRLTIVTLIVMLVCGLGTVAFLKLLYPGKPFLAAKPANIAEPSELALPHINAQNNLNSTTRAEEIPSQPAINHASDEQSVEAAKKSDDGSGPRVDRIEHSRNSPVGEKSLRESAERVTGARSKLQGPHAGRAESPAENLGWGANPRRVLETMTPKRETKAVLRPAPGFRSAGVSAKRIPSRNAADAADVTDIAREDKIAKTPSPAPLSIEVQRPRSVAARNDSSAPAATPGGNAKIKVIQWP